MASLLACVLFALSFSTAILFSSATLPQACSDKCDSSDCTLECTFDITDLAFLTTITHASTGKQRTKLSISLNDFPTVKANAFANPSFSNVSTLFVTFNGIQTVEPGAFNGLQNVAHLYLNNNAIRKVSAGMLSGMSHLKKLALENNQIDTIDGGTFSGLTELKNLNLANNKLTKLNNQMFDGASNLFLINLNNNQITTIGNRAFSGLTNVFSVYLSNNRLSVLEPSTFSGLESLWSLVLSHNQLNQVDSHLFHSNTDLRSLDLSHNNFQDIHNVHINVSSLQTLNLVSSNIKYLPSDFLKHLIELENLYLSGNKLESVKPGLFKPVANLKKLTLDSNQLTTLSVATLDEILPILRGYKTDAAFNLTLSNNPWQCEQQAMKEMFAWSKQKNVQTGIVCAV